MAQYKVPQDVEAEDKLLGPFTFRQFVYLLVAGGCIALAVLLFKVSPFLIIIPAIPAILFLVLALPLKKDQPMETYLAALLSFYLKPRTRRWTSGQRDASVKISAPKVTKEESRVRDISGEDATHRLSFLADVVDSGGRSVKGNSSVKDDLVAEANTVTDIFEDNHFDSLNHTIKKDESARHDELIKEMQANIKKNEQSYNIPEPASQAKPQPFPEAQPAPSPSAKPTIAPKVQPASAAVPAQPKLAPKPKPAIMELSNNSDFSVATIAKEAKRINRKDDSEIFISLH